MNFLLVSPVVIPLTTAVLCLITWRSTWLQRGFTVLGLAGLLICSILLTITVWQHGPQSVVMGGWPAPFGISFVFDMLACLLIMLAAVLGLLIGIYALAETDAESQHHGYFALYHVLITGVCGAFCTGDVFNLYVWFEVLLIASFVLLALEGGRGAMQAAIKYVTLNLLSSALFLAAVGFTYGTAHTLNMAHLHLVFQEIYSEQPMIAESIAMLFVMSFGIKSAMFPLFFWLPEAYSTPPSAVSAIFAGLLTKVGVYSMLRVLTIMFPMMGSVQSLLLILAGFTMIVGVFGAVAQYEFRKILAYHSISQIGYMVLGIGLLAIIEPQVQQLAIAATVVFMIHHSLIKSNLFLIAGMTHDARGTFQLKPLGGMALVLPLLAFLFIVTALSLAGLPPFSGFWAKLMMVRAALDGGFYILGGVALFTGLLTLISMIKIWNEAFWKKPPESSAVTDTSNLPVVTPMQTRMKYTAVIAMAAVALFIGLLPGGLLTLADRAAEQVLHPDGYVQATQVDLHDMLELEAEFSPDMEHIEP